MKHLINMIIVANYTCTSLPYDGKGRGFKPRINLLIVLEDTFEILFNSIYHFNSILSIMCYRRFTW